MEFRFPRSSGRRIAICLLTSITAGLVGGCASTPARHAEDVSDPLERVNRVIYGFNSGIDRFLIRPIATGYAFIAPQPVESGVGNFFTNLRAPVEAANALLQGKPGSAATNFGRFLVNSTIGIGGLIDVGSYMGLQRSPEDLGQTLAVWGVPPGPYLMIPFGGPVFLRDAAGFYGDSYGLPLIENGWTYDNTSVRDQLLLLRGINSRAAAIGPDEKLREADDPYSMLRSAFGQRRDLLIHDGNPPEQEPADVE